MALKGRGRKGKGRGMRGPRMLALTNQFGSRGGGGRRMGGRMSGPRPGRFVMGNAAFDKPHSVNYGKDTQKRVTWLNYNVFTETKIDKSAVIALQNMNRGACMALLKEMEEKGADQVKNPSGYIKAAVKRATGMGGGGGKGKGKGMGKGFGKGFGMKGNSENFGKDTQKRITWLNYNVFPENKIGRSAVQVLQMLPRNRVMALCKEVEEKAGEIKNPGGYLEAAAKRELGMGGRKGGMRKGKGKGKGKAMRAMRTVM